MAISLLERGSDRLSKCIIRQKGLLNKGRDFVNFRRLLQEARAAVSVDICQEQDPKEALYTALKKFRSVPASMSVGRMELTDSLIGIAKHVLGVVVTAVIAMITIFLSDMGADKDPVLEHR